LLKDFAEAVRYESKRIVKDDYMVFSLSKQKQVIHPNGEGCIFAGPGGSGEEYQKLSFGKVNFKCLLSMM
jgi:hypothetical protein